LVWTFVNIMKNFEIQQLINKLPVADEVYSWQKVKWKIYIAKNFSSHNWGDEVVHKLVLECRKSFRRYGDIALDDAFDKKSMVVLLQADFEKDNICQTEFFSLRVIPASGEPVLTEDLQITFRNGKNLYTIIKERLFFGQSEIENNVFTLSRFCGFHVSDQLDDISDKQRLKFTTVALSLMWWFSLKHLPDIGGEVYLTAMFNREIFNKLSKFNFDGQEKKLLLPEVEETILMPSNSLKNFSPGAVAFHYPAYFFHLPRLVEWLKKMVSDNKISKLDLNHFLQKEVDLIKLEKQLTGNKIEVIEHLSGLGKLLNSPDVLPVSNTKSAALRDDLESSVEQPLTLKIVKLDRLHSILKNFLDDLNFFS